MDPVELYQSFRKALRACQLYPEGSRVRVEASERLSERVLLCLSERPEGVSIAFLEDGVYVDHCYVSAESDEDGAPVAGELFELGLRELRFLPGAESGELLRLLQVLIQAKKGELNPVDEDLSILLWESDLSHVSYLLYEDSSWEDEVPDSENDPDSADIESPQAELEEFIEGGFEPSVATPVITSLSEAERLDVLTSYRREVEEAIPQKYGLLLIELLRVESESVDVPFLEQRVMEYLDALLNSERYQVLHALRAGLDCEAESDSTREALENLQVWFERSDLYARAAQLNARYAPDRRAALLFLEGVPVVGLPDLISLMVDPRAHAKPEVIESICNRMCSSDDAMVLCLADRRAEVRRLALDHIETVGPKSTQLVREILTDPNPELRELAATVLGASEEESAVVGLAEGIEDPEERVRTASARALSKKKGARVLELLLRSIVAKPFMSRSLNEKRSFFQAAGAVAPQEILPVLARLAEQRGLWFWRSSERKERSAAALEALSGMGKEAELFLAARWKRKRPDLLRRFQAFHPSAIESNVALSGPISPVVEPRDGVDGTMKEAA